VYGSPDSVRAQLTGMAEALELTELMIVTIVHEHAARLRSYELLARAFGLVQSRS
jgi:alkanesulfonate monooxygenase SsuD/methylene tetrahydromethanopterin reductase-like flavin-dependent oxidoreductase (luciferase family)